MGAWGNSIKQNDTVLDVVESLQEYMKSGMSVEESIAAFLAQPEWQSVQDDVEESALIHQGIAETAWTYGAITGAMVSRVREDHAKLADYASWSEPAKRHKAVDKFIERISVANAKPKALPKPAKRPKRYRGSGFNTGDCLAIDLGGGRYTAAYVVRAFQLPEQHGGNVVLEFNYLSSHAPTLEEFRTMTPLVLTHHAWDSRLALQVYGYRDKHVDEFATVVGNIERAWPEIELDLHAGTWLNWAAARDRTVDQIDKITGKKTAARDPAGKYLAYGGWDLRSQVLMQDAWDKGER